MNLKTKKSPVSCQDAETVAVGVVLVADNHTRHRNSHHHLSHVSAVFVGGDGKVSGSTAVVVVPKKKKRVVKASLD